MSEHPLCCDCLECMGGAPCPGAGAVETVARAQQRKIGGTRPRGFTSVTAAGLKLERAQRANWRHWDRRRRERTAA